MNAISSRPLRGVCLAVVCCVALVWSAPLSALAPEKVATGNRIAVAAAHPYAVAAALEMLERGGNAVDAAAAAAFSLAVVEPFGSSIGGDGSALVYDAATHTVVSYNYRCKAPLATTAASWSERREYGWNNIYGAAVPGMVDGTLALHADYGRLPREVILEPAIRYASEGFPIGEANARIIMDTYNLIDANPATAAIFLPDGLPPEVGSMLTNPDLAQSLRLIQEHGRAAFYGGPIGNAIAAHVQENGAWMSERDFTAYNVVRAEPLTITYRGYTLHAPPPPFGGLAVLLNLKVLEHSPFDPAQPQEHGLNAHYLAESMRIASHDRGVVQGDPAFVVVPTGPMLADDYAARRAALMSATRPISASDLAFSLESVTITNDPGSTTHLSVVDAEGNAVSLTQTLGGYFGCGVTVPGTGIVLNDQMKNFSSLRSSPNNMQPGKRMNSTQSPVLAFEGDELVLVMGSPGNYRIVTTVVQIISRVLDGGMSLPEAVEAPRLTARHTGPVEFESRWPASSRTSVEAVGHSVNVRRAFDLYFGGVHAVSRDPQTGVLTAVADSRRDGTAGAR